MQRYPRTLGLAGSAVCLGLAAMAYGQNTESGSAIEDRLSRLERAVATLDIQLLTRTNPAANDERNSRELDLNARLDRIELSIEQLGRQLIDLERQAASAQRAADQAQRQAQAAERVARSAEARSR